jgi:hypothetical protein
LSPAFGPWGIPEELEPPALELDDVAAGAGLELELLDEDEPPPHPATARATTASASANHRRDEIQLMFIVCTSLYRY